MEKLIGLGLTLQRVTVREVIEARRALEVEAARMAAEDPSKASRYDLQYHVMLARASHNRVLVHFINGMGALLEIRINKAVNRQPVVKEIVREHNAVLEALFARDPERAATLMGSHLTNAAERLFAVAGKDQPIADYIWLLLARSD